LLTSTRRRRWNISSRIPGCSSYSRDTPNRSRLKAISPVKIAETIEPIAKTNLLFRTFPL
jgi:hypothetical protein